MKAEDINKVSVIGAGTMGHGIAQVFAYHGYQVILYDLEGSFLKRALALIESNLEDFVKYNLATEETKQQTLSRIKVTTDLVESVYGADFITEAIIENLDVKKRLFSEVERLCPLHAIITSNSSNFYISQIGASCKRKQNLIITHWFNPAHIVPVVEVVKGQETSGETFDCTVALMETLSKKPVRVLKEVPGFVANRLQAALFREALAILGAGVASAEDIDTAVKGSFGFRLPTIGPFETADLGGLDIWLKVAEVLFPIIDRSTEPPLWLRQKVDAGKLGAKTGEGFFEYEKGVFDAKIKERDRQFLRRLKDIGLTGRDDS